ncbi:MAG: SHD1 domain-containing protein [Pirellulales bacterium]|nr:SHD1 domain-containing protein [Pirellulales bacterium]
MPLFSLPTHSFARKSGKLLTIACTCICWLLYARLGLLIAAEERTWSDTTGKFKVQGTYVKQEAGFVHLKTSAGKELKIPLAKLSPADKEYLSTLTEENPFQSVDEPSVANDSSATPATTDASSVAPSASVRTGAPKWFGLKEISLRSESDQWQLTVKPVDVPPASSKPKAINTTPKKDEFFERVNNFVVSTKSQRGMLGYVNDPPGGKGPVTRLLLLDLAASKPLGEGYNTGNWQLLALSPDGQQVLMSGKPGDQHNRELPFLLETWNLGAKGVERTNSWPSGENKDDWNAEVKWGAYVGADRVLTGGGWGRVVLWDLKTMQPLWQIKDLRGGKPAISPDQRYIAVAQDAFLGIIDVVDEKVVARKKLEGQTVEALAFSQNGKQLAMLLTSGGANDGNDNSRLVLQIADLASGNILRETKLFPIHHQNKLLWTSDSHVLIGNTLCVDAVKQAALWEYNGAEQTVFCNGSVWTWLKEHQTQGVVPVQIPHPAAKEAAANYKPPPVEYWLQPGASVGLNVQGIGDAETIAQAEERFTKQLTGYGYTIDPSAACQITCVIEAGKTEEVTYRSFGFGGSETYSFTPQISKITYTLDGNTIWQSAAASGYPPGGIVHLKQDQTIADLLREREQPNYKFFTLATLPKVVTKPLGRPDLGRSQITSGGLR